jgi:hypothetical protein
MLAGIDVEIVLGRGDIGAERACVNTLGANTLAGAGDARSGRADNREGRTGAIIVPWLDAVALLMVQVNCSWINPNRKKYNMYRQLNRQITAKY